MIIKNARLAYGPQLIERTYNNQQWYPPKTPESDRRIDLGPAMLKQLKRWKMACPPNKHNLVFPNDAGEVLNHSNMRSRYYYPALDDAKLPRVRFHDLRHTFACLLIEQGENIKYIQSQMGHSKPSVTLDVYGHLMKDSNPSAAMQLEKTIFG